MKQLTTRNICFAKPQKSFYGKMTWLLDNENYVYHGSPLKSFDIVIPKRNKRVRISRTTGEHKIIFDEFSFHATSYKWIGIAYTYQSEPYQMNGKKIYYNIGINLYIHKKLLTIYGFESLQKSLKRLYGKGGYLYTFDKKDFFHTQGLGNLEVITKKHIKPISIQRINNPVKKLRELGVRFKYIDLALSENEGNRNN